MKIIVCIKQVPNTSEVKINPETKTLIRDGVESIINPDDKNALEAALKIKDEKGAKVVVVSMGPMQAKEALLEALAMGADSAYLISDRKFGGSDTWATATILAAAIEKIGSYDLIICGRQAIDGDTAQVGPEIAEFLNIPQVTYAKELKLKDGAVTVKRYCESKDYEFEVKLPALITAIKELNTVRYPSVKGIFKAYESDEELVEVLTFDDLNVDETQIGIKGSPTNVHRSFVPVKEKHSEFIEGNTAMEKAKLLLTKLYENKLIQSGGAK